MMNDLRMQGVEALLQVLGDAVAMQKAQTVGAPVGPYMTGPGGLFGVRGLSRGIISTHTQITGSLGEVIPMGATGEGRMQNNEINPLFPYITGFLRSDQQEKDGVCDDPPEAANYKTCIQTAQFGRKEFKTRQTEINHIGQRINRGEFWDLQLENSPLVNQMGGLMRGFFGTGLSSNQAVKAGKEMLMRFIEVGVAYQRWFCPQVFTGNPQNNAAGGGYKEFPGLDLLISKTKVDAITGVACPSLYSDVKDFNYKQVDTSVDPTLIKTLTTMLHILNRKAVQQNLGPVDLRLVMRSDLFYAITEIWACNYLTYRCFSFDTDNIDPVGSFSTEAALQMKNAMRDGSYLMIDNKKYPVIQDDCISEETTADNAGIPIGGYSSDIYIVPFAARGGTLRTLYWEYYDYNKDVIPNVQDMRATQYFWSDNGAFLWAVKPPDNWCIEVISKVEPRLILKTPQLAGRLQNVVYVPLQHTDDPLPSQPYFVNGGNSQGYPLPSPYSDWNPDGPGMGA